MPDQLLPDHEFPFHVPPDQLLPSALEVGHRGRVERGPEDVLFADQDHAVAREVVLATCRFE